MAGALLWLATIGASTPCFGDDEQSPPPVEDEATLQAREAFLAGAAHVRAQKWAEALAAFERSASFKPHAVTSFNIGYCERALGHYTRAYDAFGRALAQRELSDSLAEETRGYLAEMDRLFVRASVSIAPADVAIAVDGRPLRIDADGTAVAGIEAPGPGRPAPALRFVMRLNPGAHVITLTRKGFADAVVARSFPPGAQPALDLRLERLPASLEITASEPAAAVQIDGIDVGLAPLSVSRPQGSYRVLVQKPDYTPYEARVDLQPGETTRLRAQLAPEEAAFYETWWFWTGSVALVGGVVLTTFLLTRPDPERPPLDAGSLGWAVEIP